MKIALVGVGPGRIGLTAEQRPKPLRPALLTVAAILLIAAASLAIVRFVSPHATLRIAEGLPGSPAHRLIDSFAATLSQQHPRLVVKPVATPDLTASAQAIETHKADLAIIRSDAAVPANGATIAILRRDVVAIVTPAKSPIEKIPDLAGKTIGLVEGPLQAYNSAALDVILSFYDIPAQSVRRVVLPLDEIGHAVADKRIGAALAIGPIGPGEVVDVVAAIKAATRGAPKILAVDEADAINKRFPAFESIDVPAGAFKGRPPTPDDTVTALAVTYRLAAPNSMFDIVAGAIAQSLFTAKTRLMQVSPLAAQIEAPDTDDKNPILPVHPGVASYLENGEQSFFDKFQDYFYMGGMALSAVGSVIALAISRFSRRKSHEEMARIDRLIGVADEALRTRDLGQLEKLETELDGIVAWFVRTNSGAEGGAFSVGLAHARYAIDRQQRSILREGGKGSAQAPGDDGGSAPRRETEPPSALAG
ncbi:TAXI family TRAP transporter solute-binding subunit [Methylocella silvestris]|uniref:TAXI family TRAP transporter solute-binding subunit n=1 Tax=Methylocella silvestris TaxID=199596 RepID=UPI0002D97F94|nr:TAXI family TRAP transporter solute-binding subunit [Methylocella silvestris]